MIEQERFNLQSGFINNHGNILTFEEITKNGHKLSTYEACRLLNQLYEENEGLKHHLSELQGQNEILNKENAMLKNTIARNEAHIERMEHKGEWRK